MPKRKRTIKHREISADNRKVITDVIATVMHECHRDESIDRVLCRPLDAIRMAVAVSRRCGRMTLQRANAIDRRLGRLFGDVDRATVNLVCRIALASRKRGDLRKDRY